MDIVVCIKRVPDTEAPIRVTGDGAGIDPSGVKFILSPYDEMAVEAALQVKESQGAGNVSVMTFGDASSGETLRAALAMGADEAVLLDGQPTMDGLATAQVLAAELKDHPAQLILLGVKAADDDQQQVGPMLGVLLGRSTVTGVSEFSLEGDKALCRREVEGGVESVEVSLPAVLTVTKGAYNPRRASLKGIMAAKKKPLETKAAAGASAGLELVSLEMPAPRPAGRIVGEGVDAVPELVRLLRDEAKAL